MTRTLRIGLTSLLVLLVSVVTVEAHPGIGIVQDRRGNVFFTDTRQVWRIAPDGGTLIAVPDVHTHELCLDSSDNLYGEHLWYEASATSQWRHRVWRRDADGTIRDVIPAREGFLDGYSFVRDRDGNMYWADRGHETVIRKRLPDKRIVTHAAGGFRLLQWLIAMPDGTLFLIDSGRLLRVSRDGRISTVTESLSGQEPPPARFREQNYQMGLWPDDRGHVYVAVAAERLVLRVDADGQSTIVARSSPPWSPSGGMLDRDRNLWLLEYDDANAVRVRRIGPDGRERIMTADDGR